MYFKKFVRKIIMDYNSESFMHDVLSILYDCCGRNDKIRLIYYIRELADKFEDDIDKRIVHQIATDILAAD